MECIQHEHPLSFFQLGDDDDPKPYFCRICGLPILSTPSFTCILDDANCNFFLHKACTQLPKQLYYDAHLDTLNLELASSGHNFIYKCINHSKCEFQIHPLVAKPAEIKSQHKSHKSHPLVACCRESLVSLCDACGEEQRGFFFNCRECNFWIHQDCAILPAVAKLSISPHPYILTYDPPFSVLSGFSCNICKKSWRLNSNGVYFCGYNLEMVHVACAKSKMENLLTETIQEYFIQLPDEEDTFPSLVIRSFAERNPSSSTQNYHKHPLVLADSTNIEAGEDLVCDACVQPIDHMMSSPFYRCQSDGCHFLAHNICANKLHPRLAITRLWSRWTAVLRESTTAFNSLYFCGVCFRPSNGFVYSLFDKNKLEGLCDVECAHAPISIHHASHGHHPMYQLRQWGTSSDSRTSSPPRCCSAGSFYFDIYTCVVCDFSIHIRCALLPKRTPHKFDEHPLELITRHDHNKLQEQELFCEVCEQDIEHKWWYYGCHKCEHYFHINCIPSVGFLSKVKFGKTHVDDELHQHPLTLTRMLTHQRHERCGVCKQIIEGFSNDEMAYHCSPCHFWAHFTCVSGSKNYSALQRVCKEMYY